jgi:multiple sugar transport system substrate-binding protein
MVEIEFSCILDHEHDHRMWSTFLDEFGSRHGVRVNLRPEMRWDTAWAELFSFTTHDKPPHVSHIGNTWINSLARLNVLRPFRPEELAALGGGWDFVVPNWDAGILAEDNRVWGIPWTAWMYVICYRKDLLAQAGIDPAGAFGTTKVAAQTIESLVASNLEMPWLNSQQLAATRDYLHTASSWIWAAGGDLSYRDGTKVLFNSPAAVQGLKNWLATYRAVGDAHRKLTYSESYDVFREGRAGAVLASIRAANTFIGPKAHPMVRENLGVAPVSDIPWTGGGSLVIWQDAMRNSQQEHAAVELVKFLASKEINLRYQCETDSLPARIDALKETYAEGNVARETVMLGATKGRHYYNTPTWRRIELQLSEALGKVLKQTLNDPSADLEAILHSQLDPLAEQLNATLNL